MSSFVFFGVNSWVLVFISLDRLIMIKYPKRPKIFTRKKFQIIFCILIYTYNILIYLPTLIFYDLERLEDSNLSYMTNCEIADENADETTAYMDFINATSLPFVLMLFLSILIIVSLKHSKSKVLNYSYSVTRRKQKDIKFAVTILALNFGFLVFNSPLSIGYLLESRLMIKLGYFFLLLFCSIDFFIYFATNSLMREEFFNLSYSLLFKLNLK